MKKVLVITAICLISAGCRSPQEIGPTQRGLKFTALPRALGGGISPELVQPGKALVLPWEQLYVLDVAEHTLAFGTPDKQSAVELLTADGVRTTLSATLRYRCKDSIEALARLVREVGSERGALEPLLAAAARHSAMTRAGATSSRELGRPDVRERIERGVASDLEAPFYAFGVEVLGFRLDDPQPAAPQAAEEVRAEQQRSEQLIERLESETASAAERRARAAAEAAAQADADAARGRAAGERARQAADTYYAAKERQARGLAEAGQIALQGLRTRLQALSGPGGRALLKLEIIEQLRRSGARFVVTDKGASRTDVNELLEQLGVLEQRAAAAAEQQPAE